MISLMSIFLLMFLASNVNAFEFDNVKHYDPINKEVTVTNAFGLGADIAKIKLNTPLNYQVPRGYQKVAEFTITSYEDYSDALKELELYNKRDKLKKFNRIYDYKYLTYETVIVDDYKDVCSIKFDPISGTNKNNCVQEKIGSHQEQREKWIKLTPADLKKNDVLTIGIFTDVQKGDYIEWIPNLFGVRVNEWATWTESLNVGLKYYYNFTDATDAVAGNNLLTGAGSPTFVSNSSAFPVGDQSSGFCPSGNAGWNLPDNDYFDISGAEGGQVTINFWYRKEGGAGGNPIISKKWADTPGWYIVEQNTNGLTYNGIGTAIYDGSPISDTWTMATATTNSTNSCLYRNGVLINCVATAYESATSDALDICGSYDDTAYYDGYIDELGFWNRTLTPSEITDLYNGGDGLTYTSEFGGVSVVQIEPADSLATTSASNYFSANVSTSVSTIFDNSTIRIFNSSTDLVYENTTVLAGNGTQNVNWTTTLEEGVYNWSVDVFGDTGSFNANSGNRTLTIDLTSPVVTILSPANETNYITTSIPYNVTINNSVSDNLGLSSCWYYNGTVNTTLTCGNNITEGFNSGWNEIIIYANDTAGNEAEDRVSFFINYIQENASYIDPAIEGETYNFNLTLNATFLDSLSGIIYYNGTSYNASSSIAGEIGTLSTDLTMSNVSANELRTFYWNYTLNGENYTSSTYNHTVLFITPLNVSTTCSAGLASAMCFDFKDEQNLTALNGDLDYNFKFGISNSSYKEVYGSLSNASNFCLCVNSTIYNNYTLGEGEIQYSRSGYADRRFYTFSTQRLSNSTINNTLFLLPSGSATSFLFDFKDTNLAPYIDRYTTLLRWYPNLNEYKIVEMAKTDDKGETIMRVQTEDVDYRVGLYERNGSLITLLNPVRFACISAPCSYSSLVDSSERDYTSFFGVEGGIDFNETTNIWTLTWNDPSQNTQSMNLVVTRERGDSSFTICDVSASGFTGVLTCDSSGYTGTLIAQAYRTASPSTPIFQKIINTITSPFAGSVGLFFSFILVALLMLIGVYSPVASVILGIIALLPALYMGVITLAVFIAIAVLGGIIIHFMKRTG